MVECVDEVAVAQEVERPFVATGPDGDERGDDTDREVESAMRQKRPPKRRR